MLRAWFSLYLNQALKDYDQEESIVRKVVTGHHGKNEDEEGEVSQLDSWNLPLDLQEQELNDQKDIYLARLEEISVQLQSIQGRRAALTVAQEAEQEELRAAEEDSD